MKDRKWLFLILFAVSMLLLPSVTEAAQVTQVLKASGATVDDDSDGTADQIEAAVTLTRIPAEAWVVIDKTAEGNADNVFTVRLQAQVNGIWVDVPYASTLISEEEDVATDGTPDVTSKVNIVVSYTAAATRSWVAYYNRIPSATVRIVSITTGTTPTTTFSAAITYR